MDYFKFKALPFYDFGIDFELLDIFDKNFGNDIQDNLIEI